MSTIGLGDLANETLETIFQYIPAEDVCTNIRNTSRKLRNLSYSPGFWHKYLKFEFQYSPIQRRTLDADPMTRALAIEREKNRWMNNNGLTKYKFGVKNIGTIDALRLHKTKSGQRLAVTGSRDRKVVLWDIKKVAEREDQEEWCIDSGEVQGGWVYGLEVSDDDKTVYSCGFDYCLRQHELTESGLRETASMNYGQILFRTVLDNNLLYISTLKQGVHMVDPRVGLSPVRTCKDKIGSLILSIMAHDPLRNDLFVAHGQGKSTPIAQIDKREFRVLTTFRLREGEACSSLDVNQDHLLISLKNGDVSYFNPKTIKTDFTWKVENSYEVINNITTRCSNGVVFYSTAYELSAYMPGRKPQLYAKIPCKDMIINTEYLDGDLVAITGDGKVQFWPKEFANSTENQRALRSIKVEDHV
ncbi:unnamed protein product [Bursaphelenchus xylophilus]|uniref:(pine wood nematode) hypothetical protein n=1 Tax=Bursaphelenchus xylophilus TaxID=6326 RepID=A0A1I7RPG2_BURXY|nr:unnamed protein product [Bursaphelenchus xylophilus]CAG9095971.1 unnamed protein product [Bursaphelenchus xylophilus]